MKVKKILGECLVKMGVEDFTAKQTLTQEETALEKKLLAALNVVYREAVTQYVPLVTEEDVDFKDGCVKTATLAKPIIYPIAVHRDGGTKKLKVFNDRLVADFSGKARLRYAYMPVNDLTVDGDITDMRLTISALSDGTLGEYYFENKVFDLAQSFDTDFRAQMSVLKNRGCRIYLKRRRWEA